MRKAAEARQELMRLLSEDEKFWHDAGDHEIDEKTAQAIDTRNKRIEEVEAEVTELLKLEGQKAANERRRADLSEPVDRLPTPRRVSPGEKAVEEQQATTIGEQFTSDPAFKDWFTRAAPNGNIPKGSKLGPSPAVQFKTLLTGLSSTSAGALVVNDRLSMIDAGTFGRPLMIRDLLTTGRTDSDTVEYVRQGTHTNAAAPVAEATATSGSSGAKPESAMALAIVSETVKTVAHWIPATRRALADAGQLRTLIDGFLRYGLEEELEDQVVNGDGAGENFTGIFNTTGTSTQAYDTSLLMTTRKARTKVRTLGRATPTAYVMHPNDWQAFDLLTEQASNAGPYYFGGPSQLGTPRLWGLPVVESEAITEGTALVADFRLAILWDRQQAQILTSDSHSDFFIRNLIAILAEMRAAFGVIRPAAFVEIDLTA